MYSKRVYYYPDRAYEVNSEGSPIITFAIESEEQMLSYRAFEHGTFEEGTISLKFETGEVIIQGRNLNELWKHLQVQDVRLVKCNEATEDKDLQVDRIIWTKRESN